MLDIHALRVFIEAAKTENFTEAGRRLNLTQPAVSMQIRSLETYLDTQLFEREGRSIRLTSAGEILMPMAQQIMQMTISAEETMRTTNGKIAGELVIGCSTASGKYILPHVVARFQHLYPDVHVKINVVSRRAVMERVVSGEYDLGVTSMRMEDADIGYIPFFVDRMVLIAPSSHPWAKKKRIKPDELPEERFICREPEAACRLTVQHGLDQLGIDEASLDIIMEVGNPEALAMAVEHGIGVSFVSLLAAIPRLMLGRLSIIEVEGLELSNQIELMYSCSHPSTPIQTTFLSFIEQPANRSLIDLLADGRMV